MTAFAAIDRMRIQTSGLNLADEIAREQPR